ncbi:MAG: hypothetical protein P1U64_01685 [Alcanivoracaceae bacterium]|jgi:hypothetical protein|nr:hypothetical protein [Alcanivoracaceae bacterium]
MNTNGRPLSVMPLGWSAALLPLLTIHLCFVLSVAQGHIDPCFPYWEGCSSISRAGRHGAAYFVFKGGMIPAAVLLAGFWWLNRAWLAQLGQRLPSLPWLGLVASVALLLYTLTLGHRGEAFHMLRRIGVIGYFGLTFIAQLKLSAALARSEPMRIAGQRLVRLSLLTLLIGLLSVLAGLVWPERHDDMEDGFEWLLALLLNVHALAVVALWRRSGLRLHLQSGPG